MSCVRYVVIAYGVDKYNNHVTLFPLTPKMPYADALTYLGWIEQGSKLKWCIVHRLHENNQVERVYFTVEEL